MKTCKMSIEHAAHKMSMMARKVILMALKVNIIPNKMSMIA